MPGTAHRTALRSAARSGSRAVLVAALCGGLAWGGARPAAAQEDPAAIAGADECAECHKETHRIWRLTRHHIHFDEVHRSEEGREIASKLGIRRIKGADSLCSSCHFTMQKQKRGVRAVAGVSCESCHGAARDWIKTHSEFSGKKEETETPEEEKLRWEMSEAAGMIRPGNLYALASNCYSCHVTPEEDLVEAGHPPGSDFDLLAWSQGEVRHNVWYTEENGEASPERRRMLYLMGLAVGYEAALRALGEVRNPQGEYAARMRERAAKAREGLLAAAGAASVSELRQMAEAADPASADAAALAAAADAVSALAREFAGRDGSGLGAVDSLLPAADAYVGKVAH